MSNKNMYRQVLILASAQAIFQTVSVLVMTIGGLAGGLLAPSPGLATAPIAAMFLGTASATFPASMWMSRVGRKTGFCTGAAAGIAGGAIAGAGIITSSFILLCIGTFMVGVYQSFAQFYRFAASEVASDTFRPRAISLVMAGGIVAALAGPLLARLGSDILTPRYLGSFIILAAISAVAVFILSRLSVPASVEAAVDQVPARSWKRVITQPAYLTALFGAATGYGIMILAMTATPLAMSHHAHSLSETSIVIQLHVLGMFLPSFFTGKLISRFGSIRIMLTGILLYGCHIALALTGTGFSSFAGALIFVGLGWNFLYIGGTALVTTTFRPSEKGVAQAVNDMTIFAVGLACSLSAGALLEQFGWERLNEMLLPWLAVAATALIWQAIRSRNAADKSERVSD
ncbi:MFS transporter [Klebsiella pneumoniae]|uniref:MFS transporter n=1 Tax=Klebsiella pneumoniae TaxID=573 RepID=UPI00298E55A5|nr:MFS transporter [Klebsiella pneumoniae]EKV7857233.1 MFS transporter [Klebsiella pneumoniae]MDW7408230.1 MFS transporter [Klebsiella pneumoniae]HBR2735986.1 MFS transporter [Klebsiella pneumoniae]HBR6333095.1 MFS transporter [Klebsiella pneumoniae]HBR7864467.1 MFS transporter [Klebsiella pneumoniae]